MPQNISQAQVSLTSTSTAYTQNFNGTGTTATATLPSRFKIDKQTTARTAGAWATAVAATAFAAGANMSTSASNGIDNYGDSATSTDRAVGFVSSTNGTVTGNLYVALANNTCSNLTGLQIGYNVEKYRNGSSVAAFRYQLLYWTDGSTWMAVGASFLTSFSQDAHSSGFTPAPSASL